MTLTHLPSGDLELEVTISHRDYAYTAQILEDRYQQQHPISYYLSRPTPFRPEKRGTADLFNRALTLAAEISKHEESGHPLRGMLPNREPWQHPWLDHIFAEARHPMPKHGIHYRAQLTPDQVQTLLSIKKRSGHKMYEELIHYSLRLFLGTRSLLEEGYELAFVDHEHHKLIMIDRSLMLL